MFSRQYIKLASVNDTLDGERASLLVCCDGKTVRRAARLRQPPSELRHAHDAIERHAAFPAVGPSLIGSQSHFASSLAIAQVSWEFDGFGACL